MLKEQRTFINNMIRIRQEKNMSQAELAKKTGRHRVYISHMEGASTRHKNPTLISIVGIAKGLGVTLEDLLKEKAI